MSFTYPTEYKIKSINIDGESIVPLFLNIDIFENIYLGGVTGQITIMDTDGAGFIDTNEIEFVEEFDFEIESVTGETLKFEGHLNGIRGETTKQQRKVYTIDFVSKSCRNNEMQHVTKKFNDITPTEIATQMAEILDADVQVIGDGVGMTFLGSRKKPLDIMKYVVGHGISGNPRATVSEGEGTEEQEASGTSGYLFWETLDGYRMCPIDDLIKGDSFGTHTDYKLQLQQKSLPMEQAVKGVINYEFPQIGNFQNKLRSGAYKSKHISMDMDTGEYKEYTYEAEPGIKDKGSTTQKQLDLVETPTRYVFRLFNNERGENSCEKAQENKYDQSRRTVQQNISRQNSFADQHGRITFSPQFTMRAGDSLEVTINKVSSTESQVSEENKKHSGKYILKQVSHHIFVDSRAYTKVSVIRSVTQQDETTS